VRLAFVQEIPEFGFLDLRFSRLAREILFLQSSWLPARILYEAWDDPVGFIYDPMVIFAQLLVRFKFCQLFQFCGVENKVRRVAWPPWFKCWIYLSAVSDLNHALWLECGRLRSEACVEVFGVILTNAVKYFY
jgi:hypothetical protein